MKSAKQIEEDLFLVIKSSPIKAALRGNLYRASMRPKDATTEDMVVAFINGLNAQEQAGFLSANIYIPDIAVYNDGELVEDIARVKHLSHIVIDFFENYVSSEYLFELRETPTSLEIDGLNQHLLSVQIHYRRVNF